MVSANNSTPASGRMSWTGRIISGWQSLPLRWIWLGLTVSWLALFQFYGNSTLGYVRTSSLYGWFWWVLTVVRRGAQEWTIGEVLSKDEAHIWFIPFVVAALFWMRRAEFLAMPKKVCWPAVGILVFAIGLHLTGFMVQQTRLSVVALFVGIYALMGWVWGPRWMRESLFPFFLFAFCVPMGTAVELITFPLRNLSAELSTFLSKWILGLDVYREGTQILSANQRFQYDVAPACSGIRSLVTLLALTTVFGYLTFTTLWKRLLVVALAAPLAVAGNTLRITCAVLVGEVFGHEAGAQVEQKLGFLTFLLALAALLAVAHWLRDESVPANSKNPAAPSADSSAAASASSPSTTA